MNWKFWQKRSLESIQGPITGKDIDCLYEDIDLNAKSSAAKVTPQSSWNYSAVYAAIRLLSETIAQLPLVLYQKSGDTTMPATNHPLYALTHDGPSDKLTSFLWRETQMGHTLSWGNGYAHIRRDGTERIRELELLSPSATYPDVKLDGTYDYRTTHFGRTFAIRPEDVLHIPALGWDGYAGQSPITMHRQTIGLSMAATDFGAALFDNGTNLGGVLKHPGTLGEEARENLQKSFAKFRGRGYQGAIVLDEAMDYQRIGIPPEDAQFLETRKFQVSEIARIFNIPPHMLRDLEKSSFNNISEQSIEFLRYSIAPWLVKWEQELNRKLLTEGERASGYYFKFNSGGLLRGTQKERYEAYGKGIGDGWLSRNEVRALEDLDPVDGLDEYLVPLNMAKSDEVETDGPGADENETDTEQRDFSALIKRSAESYSAWLGDIAERSTDADDLAKRLNRKLAAMDERYIEPLLTAIGGDNAMDQWRSWIEQQPMNPAPTADDISAALKSLTGGTNGH